MTGSASCFVAAQNIVLEAMSKPDPERPRREDTPQNASALAPDHRRGAGDDGLGLEFPFDFVPEPGEARPIVAGIHWVRMPLPWSLDHINLYLLEDGERWMLVDTGVSTDETKAHWQTVFDKTLGGRPVSRVLVTHHHPDHLGLAGWLADHFSAPILATRTAYLLARTLILDRRDEPPAEVLEFSHRAGLSAAMVNKQRKGGWGLFARAVHPLPVGYRRMAGGDVLKIGESDWHVIETSGHAPGHASLFEPDRKILLSGDQILPLISSNVSVTPTEPDGNPLDEWLHGLARLRALPADTLVLPSHNAPFYGIITRLDALIGKHVTRLGGVADMCGTPATAIDIFPALFRRRVSGLEFGMATGEALAHLHFLESLGVVRRQMEQGVARFKRIAEYDAKALVARLDTITEQERMTAPWAV